MRFRPRRPTPDTLVGLLITLAPLLYFLPATLGQIVLAGDDAVVFGMPLRIATAEMIRAGQLPLWNPYIFCGMPLFASAQGGTLFPLNWAFLLGNPNLAMNVSVLGSYAAAGLGAFLFARRSGASLLGAAITGLTWQMCGASVGQVTHTNIVQVFAVLPWIFWAIEGYVSQPSARRAALIPLFVALQVFAGHQQTLAYSLLLAGAYALVQASAENEPRWRVWLLSLVFLGFGLLLGAVQILPTVELLGASLRDKATYEFFSSYSLPPVFLSTWFAPYVVGGGDGTLFRAPYISEPYYPEYIAYVGIAPLILALSAPILRRDRRTLFWTATSVICLALALGRFLPFELYRLAYHIPVLNLFRVPARHLMEVDFALAVLAGRAVTFLPELRVRRRLLVMVSLGAVVLFLTWAIVTFLRPDSFRLARVAPVSVLRAPELFLPIVVAAVSCWALVRFAQGYRFGAAALVAAVICDLALWGQFSGWRTGSMRPEQRLFETPPFMQSLRQRATAGEPFRVLTVDRSLSDALEHRPPKPGIDINLQPDACMVHRIENAAGYDGFGLKRYSRLAGDMKVWGEFPDPKRTLLASPELDLLNVRYLIAAAPHVGSSSPLPATQNLGGFFFYERDLGVPDLGGGKRVEFETPPINATGIALATNLSWSTDLPDGTVAGRVTLRAQDGRAFSFDVRVGIDTSEWAYDRPSLSGLIRHSRAPIGASSRVEDGAASFNGYNFVTSFKLPEKISIVSGTIEGAQIAAAPNLGFTVQRVSFVDEPGGRTVPLRSEWIRGAQAEPGADASKRWREVERAGDLIVYENAAALPRAWLATEARALPDKQKLDVIRSGVFADGSRWEPRRTVLVGRAPDEPLGPAGGDARVTRHEPNEVEIAASAASRAILVLADNHYPDWRVTVDGRRAHLMRVNYNLRGVELEPGEHVIRFTYRPKSVAIGAVISILTAAALALWCWWRP